MSSTTQAQLDAHWMQHALQLAWKGQYTTTPNPRVGCVFVQNGQLIAQGFHERAGQGHAEVQAIADARTRGVNLTHSTAYVTLEPCAHQGRTGPCAHALISTGVRRVVVATLDPNPLVAGKGMAMLQAAGIAPEVGVLHTEARWLNRGFFSRMERQRPWVRLKIASSADGVTALNNGTSQWITGQAARADGHHLRAQACAVLTGMGTVQADDPQLNVRDIATTRQPMKVVVDAALAISPTAKLLQTGHSVIAHAQKERPSWLQHHPNANQITPLHVPETLPPSTPTPRVDLQRLLNELAMLGIQELHVEAGFGLSGAFMQAGLVDEVVQYIAPSFLGPGMGLFRLPERSVLPSSAAWVLHSHEHIGPDLKVVWVHP